ncbi:hypothetical protein [Streptomyces sp. 7N604]|uniref:hypothetical protein n=1 Tax=Streptomyces sp. 7N604 TaxID=3457415 RepID=UPI003FCFA4C5
MSPLVNQAVLAEIESLPGHTILFEPTTEANCTVACTCGGLLEPKSDSRTNQITRFRDHLRETQGEGAAL